MRRTLGVCYYPEHWPEAQWAEDAARMVETGLSWVRIGEFGWSRMEPVPGTFTWEWLDRAIEVLGSAGLKIILGTPTATPPAMTRYVKSDASVSTSMIICCFRKNEYAVVSAT